MVWCGGAVYLCGKILHNNKGRRKIRSIENMKKAFTLAEVLIVLGIVGVVAALTLPSLITNYKVKVLEARFKKADAVLQQALLRTSNEVGYDSFNKLYTITPNGELERMLPEINKAWEKQFEGATTFSNGISYLYHKGVRFHDMFGNEWPGHVSNYFPAFNDDRAIITKDGTMFSYFAVADIAGQRYLTLKFDTNGPFKGPNRVGYDIFIFNSFNIDFNSLCNPTLNHSENQKGCYNYAHRGISPVDSSKPYWDILYKSGAWWNKNGK